MRKIITVISHTPHPSARPQRIKEYTFFIVVLSFSLLHHRDGWEETWLGLTLSPGFDMVSCGAHIDSSLTLSNPFTLER